MSNLQKYARKSRLMNMTVDWKTEKFKFNLYEEVKIDEDGVTKEALNQPKAYAFLTLLHRKMIRLEAQYELELQRVYAELYVEKKAKTNGSTGRPFSEDHVKQEIYNTERYQLIEDKLLYYNMKAGDLKACIDAFEQRYSLIQTIAANQRKERA